MCCLIIAYFQLNFDENIREARSEEKRQPSVFNGSWNHPFLIDSDFYIDPEKSFNDKFQLVADQSVDKLSLPPKQPKLLDSRKIDVEEALDEAVDNLEEFIRRAKLGDQRSALALFTIAMNCPDEAYHHSNSPVAAGDAKKDQTSPCSVISNQVSGSKESILIPTIEKGGAEAMVALAMNIANIRRSASKEYRESAQSQLETEWNKLALLGRAAETGNHEAYRALVHIWRSNNGGRERNPTIALGYAIALDQMDPQSSMGNFIRGQRDSLSSGDWNRAVVLSAQITQRCCKANSP